MNAERDQRLQALFARTRLGVKFGLEYMQALLERLDNPERACLFVHVAGTNGKGSTCAIIEAGLRAAGLRTGLYSSPHLVRANERIQLDGVPVTDELFFELLDEVDAAGAGLDRPPSFFETLTAMAFLAYRSAGTQIVVLETGMGGRLDCTNVVVPLLSVITRIDWDHKEYLGDTLAKIAGEKAGIIKAGRPVVLAPQPAEAEAVLRARAVAVGSPLIVAAEKVTVSGRRQTMRGQTLNISTPERDYGRIRFPLLGAFQIENLLAAAAALETLAGLLRLPADHRLVADGLQKVRWPGRAEFVSTDPPVLLDAAHNPGGATALAALLRELFGRRARGVLFWASMADKDTAGFLRELRPLLRECVCLSLPTPRARSTAELSRLAAEAGLPAREMTPAEAKQDLAALCAVADFGCVAGSVYLAGAWLEGGTPDAGEDLRRSPRV